MKSLYLAIIIFSIVIFLCIGMQPAHSEIGNGVYIQNITMQPSTVKVGDTFTITATLVNNSTRPIWLDGDKCSIYDAQANFLTVTFDNHAKIKRNDIYCAGVGWGQKLDSGKSITTASPDYTSSYIATESGTANTTLTFSYHLANQTDPTQPSFSQNISKSFLFTILDNNTKPQCCGPAYVPQVPDSPLKQLKAGIKADDVKCADGFSLVIKTEDGSPACVKPDTAQILIEREWAKEIATQIANHGPQMKPFGPRIPVYENIANSTSSLVTALSSTVFPTTAMESFDGVSVKGYLTNQNGAGLANQEIMFYLNNATLDNGTTISENLLMGNTTTGPTGCFYFADWDANKSLQFHNEVFTTSPSGNGLFSGSANVLVYINTIFAGTNNLSGSSNATKIMYHPILPPIIREAGINAYLMNASSYFPHYSAVPILEVERGKSYNFIAFSSWSESLNVQTFRLEIKNLPCGINVPPVDVSDLKNKTQAIIPVKMIIDKTAPSGSSFFPYVSVNNHVTQPLDLVVK